MFNEQALTGSYLQRWRISSPLKGRRILRLAEALVFFLSTFVSSASLLPSQSTPNVTDRQSIPWIDSLLGRHVNSECSKVGRSAHLCVNQISSGDEIPGRKGLAIAWVTIPTEAVNLDIAAAKMKGPLPLRNNDVAILSGGFWQGSVDDAVPDGLLIEDGKTISDIDPWRNKKTGLLEGGIIVQHSDSRGIEIVLTSKFEPNDHILSALQSRPILVDGGRIVVFDNDRDHAWNRACVGIDQGNELVLVVATGDNSYALTQYEFAYLLTKLPKLKGSMSIALGMDGAYAPSLMVRRRAQIFGSTIANAASYLHVREKK